MQRLLSAGKDLHYARELHIRFLTKAQLSAQTQRQLCDELKHGAVDILVVRAEDLDGQDPRRTLAFWDLLLGRGYKDARERCLRGELRVLVKEPWMSGLLFRLDTTSPQTRMMTVGAEVQHALHQLAQHTRPSKDSRLPARTEQRLLEYVTARMHDTKTVETLWCSHNASAKLRHQFCLSRRLRAQRYVRTKPSATTISVPPREEAAACLKLLSKDVGRWCLLLPLHVALEHMAFNQTRWQYHVLFEGGEYYVWIMCGLTTHEHLVVRDEVASAPSAFSLSAAVSPHMYEQLVATKQNQSMTRFSSLLTLLDYISQPRTQSDAADVTPDGDVVEGTAGLANILPDWASECISHDRERVTVNAMPAQRKRPAPPHQQALGAHVPYVTTRVGAAMVNALVDTGASYCVVRRDFLVRVHSEEWIRDHAKHVANAPYFVLGDGSTGATSGLVTLDVSFGSRTFTANCWVFEKASYDLILGSEFLRAHDADVRMGRNELVFNGLGKKLRVNFVSSRPRMAVQAMPCVVNAARDFWLKPGQEELTDGVVQSIPGAGTKRLYGHLAPDYDVTIPNSLLANGPTIIGADGKTKVLVANFTDDAVLVRAGTRLGTFTPQCRDDFATIAVGANDPAFRKELQEALDAAKLAEERANRELPPMYFDQLPKETKTASSTKGLPAELDLSGTMCTPQELKELKDLLLKYSEFMSDDGAPSLVKGFEFGIDLVDSAVPQRMRTRRYPPGPLRQAAEKQTEDMLRDGIVRPSTSSSWSASVVLVPKKNGKLRYCVDYTALNKITKTLAYDLPRIDDFLDSLGGAKYFSSLDMMSGYWAIPVREEDKEKTAFQSPLGALEWNRTPFGLCNVPAFYARMMDVILGPKLPCVGKCTKAADDQSADAPCVCARKSLKFACAQCYLDDILVYSNSFKQHLKDLESVMDRLCIEYGLTLRASKCFFARAELEVLGHVVSAAGVRPSSRKVQAIEALQYPKDRKALKGFLGAAGYYRRFIKGFAAVAFPLNKLLKQDVAWPKAPPADALLAFETLKTALSKDCVQAHPDWSADICVETDASIHGLGATLSMRRPGSKAPGKVLQFASRSLQGHEKQYGQSELEGLCVIWALSLFRAYLLGRKFTVITDCLALKSIYGSQASKRTAGRMNRWALRLSEYTYDVEHRPGKQNVNVDLFSRQPGISTAGPAIEPLYASIVLNTLQISAPVLAPLYLELVGRHMALNAVTTRARKRAAGNSPGPPKQRVKRSKRTTSEEGQSKGTRRQQEIETQEQKESKQEIEIRREQKQPGGIQKTLEMKERDQLHKLASVRTLEDITDDLAGKLRKHYRHDKLAQHVLRKSKVQPAPGEVRFFQDARGLVRYTGTSGTSDVTAMPFYVPTSLRQSVLSAFHGLPLLGHLGFARTWPLLRQRFHWPGITRDLRRWMAACLCCRRRKDSRNVRHGLSSPMARTPAPFHTVHFDLVGPFEETLSGNVYILTLICPFSQFPFAVGIPNKEAETVARALVVIFSLVGHPKLMVSDRAKEFIGEVMQAVCRILKIKHIKTSGYQPQGNCVERFHRFLNAALTIYCHEFRSSWEDALDPILFAFRASVSASTGYSPFYLVYGRDAPLPLDSIFGLEHDATPVSLPAYAHKLKQTLQNVYKGVAQTQFRAQERNRMKRDAKQDRKAVVYRPGDTVMVWGPVGAGAPYRKTKLLYQWSKPRLIKNRVSDLHYRLLERVEGKHSVQYKVGQPVHVNRLRHYTPLPDGSPSVQNQPPPPTVLWQPVTKAPRAGEIVVVRTAADWGDKPFDVGRVLHTINERGSKRFIIHWFGNRQDDVETSQKPCYVDQRDNKRVYKQCYGRRWKPWTSATTSTTVTMENMLLVGVELTRAGKLCADDLERLETCPHLQWARAQPEDLSLFE